MILGHVHVVHTVLAKPPKDKIVLCFCDAADLCFWFNTKANAHGIGQLACAAGDHPAITHQCYLDLSRVTTFPTAELRTAQDRGPVSKAFATRIVAALNAGVSTLAPRHATLAAKNLSTLV